jgi:putative FmdB family regulatory protein
MPIYEYKCRKCGKQFEAFQGITEPELKSCKYCKGKVNKLVSLSSFSLKGSGWYVTDYAGKKPPVKTEAAETKTETKATESSTTSTDTSATTSTNTSSKED